MTEDNFITSRYEDELIAFGLSSLLESPFIQRLKGVSFLSTIDYIYTVKHPYSRYDHSLGVAYLALKLCQSLKLTNTQTKILVISNLLHDVGHSPFSHAAETFLLETKKKYHEGLLNTYLRYNTRLFPDNPGLRELLLDFPEAIAYQVLNLLLNKKTGDPIIDSLHFCPLNCDKLDGTNRTLYSLQLKYFKPLSFIEAFTNVDNGIYIKRNYLEYMYEFWQRKANVYQSYIYVNEVLAAEAMLTRALELTYQTQKEVGEFLSETDKEVTENLLKSEQAGIIFNRLINKQYFKPLSCLNPNLFIEFRERILGARFNKEAREIYEAKIASKLNINPEFLISHFSFKKEFHHAPEYTNQLSLFDSSEDMIPISAIYKAYYTTRLSGDVFDIFVM